VTRVYNFSAGPAVLPEEVLRQAAAEMLDWHGSGMSVMEMSHRGKEFIAIADQAEADLRELLAIPAGYQVLFLQGGATLQFAMVPMNLLRGRPGADYVNTGEWSQKAIREAQGYCRVNVAASSADTRFTSVPDPASWQLDPAAAYVHVCTNETIGGVEYAFVPDTGDVPLVADMSSHILSRPVDVARFGLIYAGAQKNIGPAGLVIVIVHEDLLGQPLAGTPSMLDYKVHADARSMSNTPPTYAVYVAGLVQVAQGARRAGRDGTAEHREGRAAVRHHRRLDPVCEPGAGPRPFSHERAVHAARRGARRGFPPGRGGARPAAAEGPSLGGGDAGVDLQRHARRGRAQPGDVHEGIRGAARVMGGSMRAFDILVLNAVSPAGLARLPAERYRVGKDFAMPDAVLVRSADLHTTPLPASVLAVGRAGAGTNNIPVEALSRRGVPVFNAPGANANAVKELAIAGMLMAARNLPAALEFVRGLDGGQDDDGLAGRIEDGKKAFAGYELPRHTLGVVGLGRIGRLVADAAIRLGMDVLGYDPDITVDAAWSLPSEVRRASSIEDVMRGCDIVSLHVPLVDATRHLVNADRLAQARAGQILLNFSREAIVDDAAVLQALAARRLHAYVTDFPTVRLLRVPGVIALPHLGASTREAEDNSAVMVVDQLRDYLEHGNIRHAVNFPEVVMARESPFRIGIANANVPNMLGQISTTMANAGLNIHNMLNKSRGEMAYTLVDVDSPADTAVIDALGRIAGVLAVRDLSAGESAS
jgi:D-3-phosphoglycerate dehydrogenase